MRTGMIEGWGTPPRTGEDGWDVGNQARVIGRTDGASSGALVDESTVAELADSLVAAARASGDRVIVGICGAPGAGKSVLAEALAAHLGPERAIVVPFDGFHLASSVLQGTPLAARRGALETFDLGAFRSLVTRLRARDEEVVYAPTFVRGLEEPIASAIPVPRDTPIVITEGNYLLSPDPTLRAVRGLLDAVWYLDTPPEIRLPQLVARHMAFGKAADEAEAWARGTDQRNADEIESTRASADRIITVRRAPTGADQPD